MGQNSNVHMGETAKAKILKGRENRQPQRTSISSSPSLQHKSWRTLAEPPPSQGSVFICSTFEISANPIRTRIFPLEINLFPSMSGLCMGVRDKCTCLVSCHWFLCDFHKALFPSRSETWLVVFIPFYHSTFHNRGT